MPDLHEPALGLGPVHLARGDLLDEPVDGHEPLEVHGGRADHPLEGERRLAA